ncbi:agglutinin biogenesis protein MshP [Massilia agilis]|uniref:Agglutinin biogenesis protein MshP n=1 Tax=Massilia agilis TaxID=1811226 RepID=A0ABT2D9E8_9BURK|nr:agglutinin biogenesis protein MshP [Massilia agilis]MCS0807869.1 agglutinin biogenesis protein MshP [Massilia agilis]
MNRDSDIFRRARRSAGVGIVTAIFLLVVLAGLGVAMITVFTSQQSASALDEQGARAYQAARAGIEWGLYQQQIASSCVKAKTSFGLPPGTSLSGFTVSVTCEQLGNDEDPLARWVIHAWACSEPAADGNCPNDNPSNADYVAREMEVQI